VTFLLVANLLSACQSQPIERSSNIEPNEALIVLNVRSNAKGFQQFIHPVEMLDAMQKVFGRPIATINSPGLQIFKVPCQELYISHMLINGMTSQQTTNRLTAYKFRPEPQKIIYIGDLTINVSADRVGYDITDNESETLREAKAKNPAVFEKYAYIKKMASR
jgi:hypothetical protein